MDSSGYSRLDRMLHRMAFGGIEIQKSVADIEDRVYGDALAKVETGPPVFITSLPRAGTTLLLDSIAALPGYAAHTYRSMPFILCPLLWHEISRRFQKPSVLSARAHDDGMKVGFDSPEAFEEVVWKAFWPRKYAGDIIGLWRADERHPEFEAFFRSHMRKLVLSRVHASGPPGRYVSKNNANIARIPLLRRLFPDCVIIVPFRNPLDQAASLLRQHRRFMRLHASDAFAKYYMESLGHLEFGAALKPVGFGDPQVWGAAETMNFWLEYWTAAFSHVRGHLAEAGINLRLVDFDRLCEHPEPSLRILGDILGKTGEAEILAQRAGFFHSVPSYDLPEAVGASRAAHDAQRLHGVLQAHAVNR